MTIDDLVAMARRIHDLEGYDLGAASTREYRNAYWARVLGCAYWGHPVYHPGSGDKQWHLKSAGGGRPQSDDVAVSMPSRAYWDCIPHAGADNYYFSAGGHDEPLPLDQEVYPPPVPAGGGGNTGGGGGGTGGTPVCRFDDSGIKREIDALDGDIADLHEQIDQQAAVLARIEAVAVQTRAMVEALTAALQAPGLRVDANLRVSGKIGGTAKLPE